MSEPILTETQVALLREIGNNAPLSNTFYLTGGTALAAFYLSHRYSEDLDFFSEGEVDVLQVDIAMQGIKKKLGANAIDFQQSYNRNLFFLHFDEEVVKLGFTHFPFARIEQGRKEYGVQVDSPLDIAVNKLFTIHQRSQARDYIDLYVLAIQKGYTIEELVKRAKIKFDWHIDPLQLGTQFLKAKEAEDYPRMILNIKPEAWRSFFLQEAKKLGKEIVE